MTYATFWQRLLAVLIDGLVLFPLVILSWWLEGFSKPSAYLVNLVRFVILNGYQVYCHGRYGQTAGKYAIGIRVLQLNGEKITWKQAWLRSSADILLGGIILFGTLHTLSIMPISDFYLGWYDRGKIIKQLKPDWLIIMIRIAQVWTVCGAVAILLSKKRRSLDDLIAKTLVVDLQTG